METRRPLIAANWKMFKTTSEAVETARRIRELVADVTDIDVMIAPAFTALASVAEILKESRVALGAQNLYWESEGAYTGEISAAMLVSAGCRHVIIGHSERRHHFGEMDDAINRKIKAAIEENLTPLLCVGESEEERESQNTFNVLDKQVQKGLKGFSAHDLQSLVIAYEPVWAIGTGKTATRKQAQEVHLFLRSLLADTFGNALAKGIRILYGGSVKADNISGLMAMPDIDGALVGGASLNAESFSDIVHFQR